MRPPQIDISVSMNSFNFKRQRNDFAAFPPRLENSGPVFNLPSNVFPGGGQTWLGTQPSLNHQPAVERAQNEKAAGSASISSPLANKPIACVRAWGAWNVWLARHEAKPHQPLRILALPRLPQPCFRHLACPINLVAPFLHPTLPDIFSSTFPKTILGS